MKRTWTLLGIGLALALPLTACTRDKAPDVTPTPSPVVTSQPSTMPENTPAAPNTTTPVPEGTEHPKDGGSTARDAEPQNDKKRYGLRPYRFLTAFFKIWFRGL